MSAELAELCGIARSLGIWFRDDSPPTDGYIDANGLRMHYVDWGREDRPALLFLHGASLTARTWDLVCLALREDYRCIALDQRGHGLTDGIHAFGVEEPQKDLRAAVAALRLERFALVGMSLGGNNAIAYGGTRPEGLAAVAFIDVCPTVLASGYRDAVEYEALVTGASSLDVAVDAAARHNPRGTKAYKKYTLGFSLEQRKDGRWYLRYHRQGGPSRTDEEAAAYMACRRERLWSLVSEISCPALIVHGTESKAQSRDNLADFRRKLPDARLVEIAGAGHDVQEDHPAALISTLRAFFRSIDY